MVVKKCRKNLATDEKAAVLSAMKDINEMYHVLTNKINALNSYYSTIMDKVEE